MPDQWLSVAEAAAAMKVHTRTIERRMSSGKIQFQRNDDGQVQVLVNLPDMPPAVEPVNSDAFETVKELANQQVDIAAGSASALVRLSQDHAMRAESELMLARHDARRYRRESQLALIGITVVLLGVIGAVGWCTRIMTASQADARRASDSAVLSAQRATTAESALSNQRDQLDQAIIARAKAEGELNAYKTELRDVVQMTKKPATQPTSFVGRMASLLGD